MTTAELIAALVVGHAIADYPLQGDFLAKPKPHHAYSRGALVSGIGRSCSNAWGMVWALTGIVWLGLAEVAAHAVIDDAKCRGKLSFNMDQGLHIACKALWALIAGAAA